MKSWKEINIKQFRALVEWMAERIFVVIKLNEAKAQYWFISVVAFMWPYIYAPQKCR